VSSYASERDPVRVAGRRLRWAFGWVALPAIIGMIVSANVDVRSLPVVGPERETAVLFLDGQAYFGHLDDSGESGTLVLRDVYYFKSSEGGTTGVAVGLVRRGSEAHEPADGMRINRDRVFAIERVGLASAVAQAIQIERRLLHADPGAFSLNRITVAGANALAAQRVAAEHDLARGWSAAVEQLRKLNTDLVLPVSKTEALAITDKAIADLRTVRRNGLVALANQVGITDADAYVRGVDPLLESQSFTNDTAVLLAPDIDGVVTRTIQLYAQVGDAAAKQLTQPRASPTPTATPAPTPTATPAATPSPRP